MYNIFHFRNSVKVVIPKQIASDRLIGRQSIP